MSSKKSVTEAASPPRRLAASPGGRHGRELRPQSPQGDELTVQILPVSLEQLLDRGVPVEDRADGVEGQPELA